jgi:hypothetical protein
MKRHTKIAVILIILAIYGSSIALLRGGLQNQVANIVFIKGPDTESLVVRQDITNISLECGSWHAYTLVSGDNVTASNDNNGNLAFSGNYTNETSYLNKALPFFVANQTGLELNFTANPYLHVILSSQPDSEISFLVGRNNSKRNLTEGLRGRYPDGVTETDDANELMWINVLYTHGGEKLDNNTSYVTIDVADRLAKLGLSELGLSGQVFVGLQIRQYLIGSPPFDNYSTTIKSISLIKEPPYEANNKTKGVSQSLLDGSIVHIIRNGSIANDLKKWPNLQRVYVLYKMDAPQDSLYTAFLLSKHEENLTAVRSGFVFRHTSLLNEVGTYIDWNRIPIPLNSSLGFEPIRPLNSTMRNGDYAIIFTPVESGQVNNVTLIKVEMTFSELPYPAAEIAEITSFKEQVSSFFMFFFILTIAGIVPTALMLGLYYLHKKTTVGDNKRTVIYLVLIGLALRLILAPISAHPDDTQIFSEIGALYFNFPGVLGAQWVSLPGFAYLETAAYFPYALLRTIGFREAQFLALDVYPVELLFTKIPAILSDIGSFYFILKIADKCQQRNKALIAGLYLLNPLTVYISGTLGQFDSIFTFTLIAFTYYLVADYNAIKASLFSGFAAILNPVGLATIIPLLSAVSLKKDWKSAAKGLLLIGGILGISIAPFYFFESNSPVILASYERLIGAVPGEGFYGKSINFYAYGTAVSSSIGYGLTFRFLLETWGVELSWWYYPFTAALILIAFVAVFIYKTREACKEGRQRYIHIGTFMLGVVCLFQLTFPMIYEQFVVWVAGLMLVSYILYQNRKIFAIFLLTCISAGFFYVITWRNYLRLAGGVEVDFLGVAWWLTANLASALLGVAPWLTANLASALLGVTYSVVVAVTFIITCELMFKEELARLAQRIRFRLKKHKRAQSV